MPWGPAGACRTGAEMQGERVTQGRWEDSSASIPGAATALTQRQQPQVMSWGMDTEHVITAPQKHCSWA